MKTKTRKIDKENPNFVSYSQSFAAVVVPDDHGGKKLKIRSLPWYQNQVNKFRENEEVTLMIHNRKPKRTEAQNNYYWGVYLPLISRETGEQNLDALHELFKGLFLSMGIQKVLGKPVRMKKSTTALSKFEFSEYIMAIEAETGVAAPPTENYYGLDPIVRINKN